MQEGLSGLINSPGGLAGSIGGGIIAAAFMIRKFILSDKVASATANANVDVIEKLTAMVERAEKRADIAEARADAAYKERNEAIHEIGALREQVRNLQTTVEKLERGISNAGPK